MKQIKRNGVEISVGDEYTLVEGEELVEKTEEEEKEEVAEETHEAGTPMSKEDSDFLDKNVEKDVPPAEPVKEE